VGSESNWGLGQGTGWTGRQDSQASRLRVNEDQLPAEEKGMSRCWNSIHTEVQIRDLRIGSRVE
jgi:hypothetical protein